MRCLATCLLVLTAAGPAGAQQTMLDLIPADAVAALAIRNLDELKAKGDKLIADAELNVPLRPSELFAMAFQHVGVQGGVESKGAAAVILAAPEQPNAQLTLENLASLVVVALPFAHRDKMAANFGLKPGELPPNKIVAVTDKQFTNFVCARGNHVLLAESKKTLERVLKAKSVRDEVAAGRRKELASADILLHLGPPFWGEMARKGGVENLEKQLTDNLPEADAKVVRQFVRALAQVHFAVATVRLDGGIGLGFLTTFPKKGADEAHKLLATLGSGPGGVSLTGLPDGPVVVAQATRGDGAKTAVLAKTFFELILKNFVETKHILSSTDRPVYLGILDEVWQRLRGNRAALYLTGDEQKLGLFSLVAVLDTDNAKQFLSDMRLLARIADESESGTAAKEAALDPAKLIEDLGSPRYRVRESATLKLRLMGETALPALKRAAGSDDPETARRADALHKQIAGAAAERRKELLAKELPRHLRPKLTFAAKAETRAGHAVDIVRIRLGDGEVSATKQLRQLLGPDWNRMRLAVHDDKVVVLLGSDVGLFDRALANLKDGKPGLAESKALAGFNRQASPARRVEFHVAVQTILGLTAPPGDGRAPAPGRDLTSFALAISPDGLQLDIWVPTSEIRVIAEKNGMRKR
jgi:hypothetical protein